MPKVCKLPRTDYGSTGEITILYLCTCTKLLMLLTGALQYYLHHLEQVGKYKDLKVRIGVD